MTYRFARERVDNSDFATGRVLVSAPGRTAFPVRLADEVFQRCLALRPNQSGADRVVLYDPVCGSAAMLTTLAFLHGEGLDRVIGSDMDPEALILAERNLALLTPTGLQERLAVLTELRDRYGKASHDEAVDSAKRLRTLLVDPPVATTVFRADATDSAQIVSGVRKALGEGRPHPDPLPRGEGKELRSQAVQSPLPVGEGQGEGQPRRSKPGLIDVVIADVPYGIRSFWAREGDTTNPDPLWAMLEAIRPILAPAAVVAIAGDKGQRPRHDAYVRREWFQVGKRRIEFLAIRTEVM